MLTFEKIRDIERAEHDSKELQKMPPNFMEELTEYIERKKQTPDAHEIKNTTAIIQRILDKRQEKLVSLALYSAKTDMPVENLTKEEDEIFLKMLEIMKKQRENFLTNQKKDTPLKNDVTQERPRQHVYIAKKPLGSFVGPDLKVYTIKENEIIALDKLPKPLNDLLLKEGVIEPIEK